MGKWVESKYMHTQYMGTGILIIFLEISYFIARLLSDQYFGPDGIDRRNKGQYYTCICPTWPKKVNCQCINVYMHLTFCCTCSNGHNMAIILCQYLEIQVFCLQYSKINCKWKFFWQRHPDDVKVRYILLFIGQYLE